MYYKKIEFHDVVIIKINWISIFFLYHRYKNLIDVFIINNHNHFKRTYKVELFLNKHLIKIFSLSILHYNLSRNIFLCVNI